MSNKVTIIICSFIIFIGCKKELTVTPGPTPDPGSSSKSVSVLTQHNDNTRAGLNNQEKVLNTSNVNSTKFGKLFTLPVDDEVYAQPLIYGDLNINGGTHTVVLVATVNNSVYAFDADNGAQYWTKNLTPSGQRPPNVDDIFSGYDNFTFNFGIVGTPVIDATSKTLYLVARSSDGSKFYQYLHAINITTGNEQPASPVLIKASVAGTGDGNQSNVVSFDPLRNNQRQGLALSKGIIYISYSSHGDWGPYHGWVLGYDAQTLQQVVVYNDTPDGEEGGIWVSGMGIAADNDGAIYITTGNGTVGQGAQYPTNDPGLVNSPNPNPSDLRNRAESSLKLVVSGTTLKVSSFFTPTNYADLNSVDNDYGSMGSFLIPNSTLFVTGGKDGNIHLLNKDNMGGVSGSGNQVLQTIPVGGSLHSQPAFYSGSTKEFAYIWSEGDKLRALPFNRSSSLFSEAHITSTVNGPIGGSGADLSVTSDGIVDGTGILWASYAISTDADNTAGDGILRAFDANDITKELWNSGMTPGDAPGFFAKFCSPTIANGHVYLATFSKMVVVYGLK